MLEVVGIKKKDTPMTKAEDKLDSHITNEIEFRLHVVQRLTRIETYQKANRWWSLFVAGITSSFVAVTVTLVVAYLEKK